MAHSKGIRPGLLACVAAVSWGVPIAAAEPPAFERSEVREPCAAYDPLRRPMFGDLNIHTRYSFDSYVSGQRNDPWDAYAFAAGAPVSTPDGKVDSTVAARLRRPLDFAAVTDHADSLGQVHVCTEDPSALGYWWPHCIMTRSQYFWARLLAADWWLMLAGGGAEPEQQESMACSLSDCDAGAAEFWGNIRKAAEEHYDRSSECAFTTFVGYAYTGASEQEGLRRSVIFRNEHVVDPTLQSGGPEPWQRLQVRCREAGDGCDALSIPHGSNLSGGMMFPDPKSRGEVSELLAFGRVVERTRRESESTCRFDRSTGRGVDEEGGLCDFEPTAVDGSEGLAVVWAEENSRDAIFSGIRRRETYATSGTRPVVRFFGGWDYPADSCDSPDLMARGYAAGVPMGGEMPARREGSASPPTFLVSAMKDPGRQLHPGADLQLVQVVKGWMDADGATHEAVYDVAGDPDNGADVDRESCEPTGTGYTDLCTVWRDALFDPAQPAYYYMRVLENPTCAPTTRQCLAAGVDPFSDSCEVDAAEVSSRPSESGGDGELFSHCCPDPASERFHAPIVRERAWTAPIRYRPESGGSD